MSKLQEYLTWKEVHQRKAEQHLEAVKYYEEEIVNELKKTKEEK